MGPLTYKHNAASIAEDIQPTPRLEDRWALETINVADAWAHLQVVHGEERPGSGVTVGVLDTGIDLSHPMFIEGAAAGEVTEAFLQDVEDETGEEFSHGTGVASIITGRVNPQYTYPYTGIAPYAALRMFTIPLGDPPPADTPFDPITLSALAMFDEDEAALFQEILSQDLDILNLSFVVQGLVENYDDVPELYAAMGNTLEALAQADREDRTILVWAAGNFNERLCRPGTDNCTGDSETDYLGRPAGILDASSPSLLAGLVAHAEELRGHSIAVVAIGEPEAAGEGGETAATGEIAFFSNRCGIAADWCIAAPGEDVLGAYSGPYEDEIVRSYAYLSGTSFAAPMVTGGLALMKQMFRDQLRNEELVTRLFRTADKSGPYADRDIYGQGLMDLGAAVSPVGEPAVTNEETVAGGGTAVQQTRLGFGPAFGSRSASAFTGQEIAAFDALGAPFWYDLGDLVLSPAPPSAGARLREFLAAPSIDPPEARPEAGAAPTPLRLGIRQTPGEAGAGHALLAPNALTLTFGRPGGVVTTAFTHRGRGEPRCATRFGRTGGMACRERAARPAGGLARRAPQHAFRDLGGSVRRPCRRLLLRRPGPQSPRGRLAIRRQSRNRAHPTPRAGRNHRRRGTARDQRIRAPCLSPDRRKRDAAGLALPAASSRGRRCRAVRSRRPHCGPRGCSPAARGRPCPRGPAARSRSPLGTAARGRRVASGGHRDPPRRSRRRIPTAALPPGRMAGVVLMTALQLMTAPPFGPNVCPVT